MTRGRLVTDDEYRRWLDAERRRHRESVAAQDRANRAVFAAFLAAMSLCSVAAACLAVRLALLW